MGGDLTVESAYGAGSTFTVRLPADVTPKSQEAASSCLPCYPAGMQVRAGIRCLTFIDEGRAFAVLSRARLGLVLALERRGKPLPARESTRTIWPDRTGPLNGSQPIDVLADDRRLQAGGLIGGSREARCTARGKAPRC
jgi:hypothetical protein